jgi:hypothetical protein
MGGSNSKSTTTNKSTTNIVNNSDLNILNENVNDFVSDTVVSQASNCSASMSQMQALNISNVKTKGDFVLDGITQSQKSTVTFDCLQVSKFKNDIANGVLTKYMDAISNNYNTSAIADMTASAKSNAATQFAATGKSKSNSATNNNFEFNSTTNVNQDIQNIVKNSIKNNMSIDDVQNCIASVSATQAINIANIESNSFTIRALDQSQASDLLAKCVQKKDNGNKISSQIATDLGLKIEADIKTTSSAKLVGTSESEATNVGALQSAGEGMATVFKGIGSMWSGIFGSLGFGDPTISLYCCIVIVIFAVLGGVGYYFYQKQQNGDDESDINQMGGTFVKFDTLKFVVLLILFILILGIYKKQN